MNKRRIISNKRASRPKAVPKKKKTNPKKTAKKIVDQRYLIRAKIAAARKARRKAMADAAAAKQANRYVVSRRSARTINRRTKKNVRSPPPKPVVKTVVTNSYSGTIIYDGKTTLHPYKWTPTDAENSPAHYKWETLMPGTHILDKNTCLTWIVTNKRSLNLAPCQTIRLEMGVPESMEEFNPGLSLNPFLPETKQIPVGTRFIFRDSNQVYALNERLSLEALVMGNARPSQVIPVGVNSLYNTNQMFGLNTPITTSSLQQPTGNSGYRTLKDWFNGLIRGSDGDKNLPGYLGHLPKLDQLQAYDVIDFYDPNLMKNPKINMLNPDGTPYVDGLHESRYFSFKLQIVLDKNDRLTGREITEPSSPFLCNISIPTEKTNQGRPIYIRSASLIPHLGEPIRVLNQIAKPYYMDSELDADRFLEDFLAGLLEIGYPYQQIKISYLGEIQDFYVFRFSNLPTHLWGVVFSSDTSPLNKYAGSGRFFLGYSANSQGSTYSCELETDDDTHIVLELLNIQDVTVDGMLVKLDDLGDGSGVIQLSQNRQVSQLLNRINQQLSNMGYPGYVMNMWWNEAEYKLKFYLSGVVNQTLPSIMININGNMVPLDFLE